MPIYKRCPRCGKRILEGTNCGCVDRRFKEYDKTRDKDIYNFYRSHEWGRLSQYMRIRYKGLDVYELMIHEVIVPGETIHHIKPVDEYWDDRFNTENLILLSESNHRKVHALMKTDKKQKVIDTLYNAVDLFEKYYGY